MTKIMNVSLFFQHIFMLEQEEYRGEGINWKEIKFVDNKSLLVGHPAVSWPELPMTF